LSAFIYLLSPSVEDGELGTRAKYVIDAVVIGCKSIGQFIDQDGYGVGGTIAVSIENNSKYQVSSYQ